MGNSENRAVLLTSRKTAALAILLYAGLSGAVLVDASWLGYLAERLPRWAGLIGMTAVGPALLLAGGIALWKWYVGSLLAIAACLAVTWLAWRQRPDSEVFVVGLLTAGALWAGSGWLIVAFMW
jgi:hypothetical protein